ncbi:MAG: hypothetical protein V8S31_00605 [Lachnospiraceae bacterium]
MDNSNTGTFDIYKDISARTNGEIYIGVVGGVRSGKSTFIKRFMELMVLPFMEDERKSGQSMRCRSRPRERHHYHGAEIIPKEAATISLSEDTEVKVRMIDCVGDTVDGANGHMENGEERMKNVGWMTEIPFTQAAEIGTQKVIRDHATIGIVVTADGSFSDIPREKPCGGGGYYR